jgi:hypothetical protein
VLFAYLGPDVMLPLASVVATVLGMVMMFGRVSLRFALAPFRWITRHPKQATGGALRGPMAWRKGAGAARAESKVASHAEGEA